MRTLRASIAVARTTGTVLLAAWSVVAGCKGNATSSSGNTFGDDGDQGTGSSSGGSGSSGGAGASSGGGSASTQSPTMPSADYADGGISCGPQAGCAPSEQCCYGAPATSEAGAFGPGGFGGGFGAPSLSCTSAGSCSGSSLSCSSSQHCSGGQVCCFVYQASEAGAGAGGPGGGFAGFGAPMTFTAACADECPGGDMVHYQLCASSDDCPNGQACIPGTYTTYCADMGAPPGGPTNPTGPTNPQDFEDGGSD